MEIPNDINLEVIFNEDDNERYVSLGGLSKYDEICFNWYVQREMETTKDITIGDLIAILMATKVSNLEEANAKIFELEKEIERLKRIYSEQTDKYNKTLDDLNILRKTIRIVSE